MIIFWLLTLVGLFSIIPIAKAMANPEETMARHRISKGLGTRGDYEILDLPVPTHMRKN